MINIIVLFPTGKCFVNYCYSIITRGKLSKPYKLHDLECIIVDLHVLSLIETVNINKLAIEWKNNWHGYT